MTNETDVLIIGAGISGISAAHHISKYSPNKSYTILERRADIGGTWNLFKYPGIRSDSDMFTLGFSFRPWTSRKSIADAPSILSYLRETLSESGLGKFIQFNKKVHEAKWSSAENMWSVDVEDTAANTRTTYKARFIHLCTGYYNYDEGYRPEFPNEKDFEGEIIHPQFWREDLDYSDKKVVVIGSGATAVTIVPSMADKVKHITMLQRSPTYIIAAPAENSTAILLRRLLPNKVAYGITRWMSILYQRYIFWYCKTFPARAKKFLLDTARTQVPADFDFEKHLVPDYNPWDQRLCLAPDGDFFKALCSGKASIATDTIESFTKGGIKLASGEELAADIIITATGLDLAFFGKINLNVDGKQIQSGDVTSYKGIMFSSIPNLALSTGYTNASWTLKCDLTSSFVCRLLNYMDKKGYEKVVANADEITATPILDLASGYIARKADIVPKQGVKAPWKLHHNYLLDLMMIRFGSLHDDAIEFSATRIPAKDDSETNIKIAAE